MITYTATYIRPGWFRNRPVTLKNVIGDGIDPELGFRFFQQRDGEMTYIPLLWEASFSAERTIAIEKETKKEAGK